MSKKSFPAEAFRFFATAELDAPTDSGVRRFEGVAYSGEVITDHWLAPVAFDLSTISIPTPLPVLYCHEHEEAVGVVDSAEVGDGVKLLGALFSDVDECAKSISDKADRGFPWGLSLGIIPGSIEEVSPGVSYSLNGRNFTGPLTVFKNARVREVSFCSVAADQRTSTSVFSADSDQLSIEVQSMTDTNDQRIVDLEGKLAAADAKFAAAEARASEAEARAIAAETALKEFAQAARKAEVAEMFSALGREVTDDAIKPYMAMSGEVFSAVKADLVSVATKKKTPAENADPVLFSHQAIGGNDEAPRTFADLNAIAFKQFGGNA